MALKKTVCNEKNEYENKLLKSSFKPNDTIFCILYILYNTFEFSYDKIIQNYLNNEYLYVLFILIMYCSLDLLSVYLPNYKLALLHPTPI